MPMTGRLSLEQVWPIWRDCLNGTDPNSIFQQIDLMIYDTAIFRLVLECRRSIVEQYPKNPPLNASFHRFIDRCFFITQAAYIRRLSDQSYSLHGNKGVYSIYSLLQDIRSYRELLTREMYFKLRELNFDYSEALSKEQSIIHEQLDNNESSFQVLPEVDWEPSDEAHVIFDRLSGKNRQSRSSDDVIRESVFDKFDQKLVSCRTVTKLVDKYIAHSATPESRYIDQADSKITLKHIWDLQELLYYLAAYLSRILFGVDQIPLVWKTPNLFKYWDRPMIEKGDFPMLEAAFEQYRVETERWRLEGVERLWQWLES